MAQDDLQLRIGVEHAGQHHAHALRRGLHGEAPGRAHDHRPVLHVVLVIGLDHRRMRHGRMQIQRHVQRRGALADRPEALVVEEHAVGRAVDQRALEAELRHRALQFIGRGLRIGRRDGGEGGEPVGMRAHRLGQAIVGDARQRHRGRGIHLLQSGIGVRQHLHVDPRLVHLLDAKAGQVVQPFRDGGNLPLILGRIGTHHVRVLVVLLDGDHARLCWHGGLPVRPDFCHSGDAAAIRSGGRTRAASLPRHRIPAWLVTSWSGESDCHLRVQGTSLRRENSACTSTSSELTERCRALVTLRGAQRRAIHHEAPRGLLHRCAPRNDSTHSRSPTLSSCRSRAHTLPRSRRTGRLRSPTVTRRHLVQPGSFCRLRFGWLARLARAVQRRRAGWRRCSRVAWVLNGCRPIADRLPTGADWELR